MPDELSRCAAGLERSMLPVWVLDAGTLRIVWANAHALGFWGAASREELFARDIIGSAPPAVLERMQTIVAKLSAGETVREEWIMYPGGNKTTVMLEMSALSLEQGAPGIMLQAQPLGLVDEQLQRNIAMFRHSTVVSALVEADGRIAAQNPAASERFGARETWQAWFHEASQAQALLDASLTGAAQHALVRVCPEPSGSPPRWHMVELRTIRDPVSAELGALVEHIDVSAQVEAEDLATTRGQQLAALNASLEVVARQRAEILALSAPLLDVGRGTVAVPVIGRLDRERTEALTTKLLVHASERGLGRVILDLTGAAELDARVLTELDTLVDSLGLLGVETLLSGLRPSLARALASAQLEPNAAGFYHSLAAALGLR